MRRRSLSLHSGHYGNWAPNPAMRRAQLLAGMKDDQGKVTIAGFDDTVAPPEAAVAPGGRLYPTVYGVLPMHSFLSCR